MDFKAVAILQAVKINLSYVSNERVCAGCARMSIEISLIDAGNQVAFACFDPIDINTVCVGVNSVIIPQAQAPIIKPRNFGDTLDTLLPQSQCPGVEDTRVPTRPIRNRQCPGSCASFSVKGA